VSEDANGYRNTLLDDVDLRKWSLEHDKEDERLQARRDRMRPPPRR